MTISASIYEFSEPSITSSARELWAKICSDLSSRFPDTYKFDQVRPFKVILKNEMLVSPSKALARRRIIHVSIRRAQGKQSLLDISIRNEFSSVSSQYCDPISDINSKYPEEAKWINSVQKIPLADHLRLIESFLVNSHAIGRAFTPAKLEVCTLPAAKIRNGRSEFIHGEVSRARLIKNPYQDLPANVNFVVGSSDLEQAGIVADRLQASVADLLGPSSCRVPTVSARQRLSEGDVNLWLLRDNWDLAELPELRAKMRDAEERGIKFKLCKFGSTGNRAALANISYDMCLIAGLIPYVPITVMPNICAVDAGHSSKKEMSRWVYVESDGKQVISKVRVFDTELAENLPEHLFDSFWPESEGTIFCRDGRFSRERSHFESRAKMEKKELIECKKSPASIIWRNVGDGVSASIAGDCVVDPHGEFLLQTINQNIKDYVKPLRLRVHSAEALGVATQFYQHQAMPGLSLFNSSRLPGTLYYADLISKLTTSGWPKVVGRGLNLGAIIP